MTRRQLLKISLAIVLGACLLAAGGYAQAKEKPFKISGAGVTNGIPFPDDEPCSHWSIGNATHLGKYDGAGAVDTLSIDSMDEDGNLYGTFESAQPFVFVGKNGDKLVTYYGRTDHGASEVGTFKLVNLGNGSYVAQWKAEFVAVTADCTGRFAGVSGSWVMFAESAPFVPVPGSTSPVEYAWWGEGTLDFPR